MQASLVLITLIISFATPAWGAGIKARLNLGMGFESEAIPVADGHSIETLDQSMLAMPGIGVDIAGFLYLGGVGLFSYKTKNGHESLDDVSVKAEGREEMQASGIEVGWFFGGGPMFLTLAHFPEAPMRTRLDTRLNQEAQTLQRSQVEIVTLQSINIAQLGYGFRVSKVQLAPSLVIMERHIYGREVDGALSLAEANAMKPMLPRQKAYEIKRKSHLMLAMWYKI